VHIFLHIILSNTYNFVEDLKSNEQIVFKLQFFRDLLCIFRYALLKNKARLKMAVWKCKMAFLVIKNLYANFQAIQKIQKLNLKKNSSCSVELLFMKFALNLFNGSFHDLFPNNCDKMQSLTH